MNDAAIWVLKEDDEYGVSNEVEKAADAEPAEEFR